MRIRSNSNLAVVASIILTIAGIGFLTQCRSTKSGQPEAVSKQSVEKIPAEGGVGLDEYYVYSVVLADDRYSNRHATQVVIRDHTLPGFTNQNLQESAPRLLSATIRDYEAKNKTTSYLRAVPELKVKYTLLTDDEVDRIFHGQHDGWKTFYSRFPRSKGLISLSRVGFDPERKQALLYVRIGCDWTCGDGQLVFLKKEGNVWRIEAKILTAVS